MGTGAGILFSQMDCPPELETDFDRWYNEEHIPKRLAVPGFTAAARYQAVTGGPKHLAVYHTTSPDIFNSPEYIEVKHGLGKTELTQKMLGSVSGFTRYLGTQITDTRPDLGADSEAPFITCNFFSVPEEDWPEFNRWYEEEHVPLLMSANGWMRVRRYRIFEGEPESWTTFAFHELTDLAALDSPERQQARSTPWRARMAEKPWFQKTYMGIYQRRPKAWSDPS